jgi:hypothetical protein
LPWGPLDNELDQVIHFFVFLFCLTALLAVSLSLHFWYLFYILLVFTIFAGAQVWTWAYGVHAL